MPGLDETNSIYIKDKIKEIKMIGWVVQIRYSKNGFAVKEKKYINYESADDEITTIEQRIKKLLEINNVISVYIEWYDNTNYTIEFDFCINDAYIIKRAVEEIHVTSEDAKRFLKDTFLQIRKQAKEMCDSEAQQLICIQLNNS